PNPEHILPRRNAPRVPILPNRDEVERQRQMTLLPPELQVPEDRTHRLIRREMLARAAAPLPPQPALPLYPLPRKASETQSLASVLPSFAIPAQQQSEQVISNRWRIAFPNWQRYADTSLDTVYARQHWWDPF